MTTTAPTDLSATRLGVLGIRGQLLMAFGGIFAVFVTIFLVRGAIFQHYISLSEATATDHLDSITAARDMRDAVDDIAAAAGHSRLDDLPLDRAAIDASMKVFDQAMALQTTRMTLPGEDALTREIQVAWEKIREAVVAVCDSAESGRAAVLRARLQPAIREIRPMITRLSRMNADGIKSKNRAAQEGVAATRQRLYLVLLLGLIVAIGFAVMMAQRMVRPLGAMSASAKAIARGDFEQNLPVRSRDELGELSATFNRMAGELRRLRAMDADRLHRARPDCADGDRQPAGRGRNARGARQGGAGQ